MLEKMSEFFENRLDGYDEHMLTDIESADEFYPFTAKQLPTAKSIEKSDSKVSQAVNATVWN